MPFFGANCHAVLDEKQKTQPIESLLFTGIEQRIHPIFPHKRQQAPRGVRTKQAS
jgi:hypothetical protein